MTLHALFIAINTYDPSLKIDGQYAFKPLQGCVPDAQALHDWLGRDTSYTFKPKLLFNEDATKANIVAAFQDHLSTAQSGDAILIFYSGHGTIELADQSIWREEKDGRLEGLACYYEQGDSGKFILADKEIRYLLKQISKPEVHILTLFDSCHSGDNTRNAIDDVVVQKNALVTFKQRSWDDFIFSEKSEFQLPNKFKREEFIWNNLSEILPEGDYIQLAAAESNEPAIEALINRERHGVFGYFMLEMLRENGGHISYRDLCNRIRNRIRYKYEQRIKIYAPRHVIALQESGFLKKEIPDVGIGFGTVDFNPEAIGYRINRGILDRVVSRKTKVTVTDTGGSTYEGIIGAAELNTAEVIFDGTTASKLSKKPMSATLTGLASRALRICFLNKDQKEAEVEWLSEALFSTENESFVQLESDENLADYTLLSWAGMYYLTKPGDWYRPVVMPVFQASDKPAESLLAQLKHIAQWHFMLDLRNETSTKIPTDMLQVEIADQNGNTIPMQDSIVEVPLSDAGRMNNVPMYTASINIRMTNNGQQDIYVQPVLLMDYGCWVTLITNPDSTRPIEPKNFEELEINVDGTKTKSIMLSLDTTTRLFNHEKGSSTLKFIISLAPINGTAKFDLAALPMPEELLNVRGTRGDTTKGMITVNTQAQTLPDDGWNALNIALRTKNPLFNQPDKAEIESYTADGTGNPFLAHFLKGLHI